ncbi:TPA: glycosyltransferase family 2 protein [Candidatus Woesearchaeota archaeon]|nr:glycosyltransferase family 2 protein [Candidatus Woesearchaeota archaeon]HLD43511.1 glycosyltransferase family A protein [Candidatus Nanoarchaeia archaeon]
MSLTIIISALNEEQNIEAVLSKLENQVDEKGNVLDKDKYNVLVVDNGSSDDTAKLVRRFSEQSELHIGMTYEPVQNIITARRAGVRELQANKFYANTRFLAFCDADVSVPGEWISSMMTGFKDRGTGILSYNGSFPHSFWEKVPRLVEKYVLEVGTLFFPMETITYYEVHKRDVKFTRQIYSDFVRPPSGGFYAIRLDHYNSVNGYEREFTDDGKEVDGPTWRLYIKLMGAGANLKFIPDIEMINSERRLLGAPEKFFRVQEYDQLSDLRQDLRERSDSQYSFVDNLASSIDFTPVQRYVTQYYLLFPCVNRPELIGLNETYFGSLKRAVETDILQWRSKNNRARGQDVFRFCDELTDKYSDKLWHEIPTGREEAQPPKSRK